jgi:predicted nucleic acid-binding protein
VTAANAVDSSGWLEYFADTRRARLFAPAIEDPDRLIVPVLTVYEVFKKFLRERGESDALQAVSAMRSGQVVDLDVSLALEAGRFALPLADSLIYATAQRHSATLWTQDEDFHGLPGVRYFARK